MLFALSKSGVFSKKPIVTGASGLLYGFRSLLLSSISVEYFRKRSIKVLLDHVEDVPRPRMTVFANVP